MKDQSEHVICRVCMQQMYSQITLKHLKSHDIESFKHYRRLYPGAELKSKMLRDKTKMTLELQIKKYGESEGMRRFNEYRKKQSVKNTFEYKHQKYGWTREQFDNYNKTRACTKENFIRRHGELVGLERWSKYIERQQYAGSSEQYFIDLYGEIIGKQKWKQVNKLKSNNLQNYISKYGKIEGVIKYREHCENRGKSMFHSKISQELFCTIQDNTSDKIYFATNKHGVFSVYDAAQKCVKFFDYVDTIRKKCIEFNGDCYHANPRFYTENCRPNYHNRNLTSQMIWDEDAKKLQLIKDRGYDILIVWESDYLSNSKLVTQQCMDFLYGSKI